MSKVVATVTLVGIILINIFWPGRMTMTEAMYQGNSPFRQFISFYFSYIPIPTTMSQGHPIPDTHTTNNNNHHHHNNNDDQQHERNDYHYHYYKSIHNSTIVNNLEASTNDSCIFHTNSDSFFEQCDIYSTKLFCYPRLTIFSHSWCDCFNWHKMKQDEYLLREIFQEDDQDTKTLLIDLADFLSIEMEWDHGKCRSLNGSACSVPEPQQQQQQQLNNSNSNDDKKEFTSTSESQDNNGTTFDTVQEKMNNDPSYISYVQCSTGLTCREINEMGFVIGRCLPSSGQ